MIGAGPSGLAGARNLQRFGIPWTGFELGDDVGGLWNIDAPRSTVYESAHLISSRTTTQFAEFPMQDDVADYPSHRELFGYFSDFADHYGLRDGFSLRHRGRADRAARMATGRSPPDGRYDDPRRGARSPTAP